MRSLRRAGLGLALVALWATSVTPILASDNGTVDATVTVATPCVTVSPSQLDFGTLPFSSLAFPGSANRPLQVHNCGSSGEQLFIRGTDATLAGAAVWTLNAEAQPCYGGLNEYTLIAGTGVGTSTALTKVDQLAETVGADADAATNSLALYMPCAGSNGIGSTLAFQAIFTAAF